MWGMPRSASWGGKGGGTVAKAARQQHWQRDGCSHTGMKDGLTNRTAASIKTENGLPVVCKVCQNAGAFGTGPQKRRDPIRRRPGACVAFPHVRSYHIPSRTGCGG